MNFVKKILTERNYTMQEKEKLITDFIINNHDKLPLPHIAGKTGHPCKYCIHWKNMCGPDIGEACINYANFKLRIDWNKVRKKYGHCV